MHIGGGSYIAPDGDVVGHFGRSAVGLAGVELDLRNFSSNLVFLCGCDARDLFVFVELKIDERYFFEGAELFLVVGAD